MRIVTTMKQETTDTMKQLQMRSNAKNIQYYLFLFLVKNSRHGLRDVDGVTEGRFEQGVKGGSVGTAHLNLE